MKWRLNFRTSAGTLFTCSTSCNSTQTAAGALHPAMFLLLGYESDSDSDLKSPTCRRRRRISRSILLWLETEDGAAIRRRPESKRWMMKTIMFQGFHMASWNSCPALIVLVFCLVHSISGERGARVPGPPLITAWGMIGEGSLPAVRAETYCLSPG